MHRAFIIIAAVLAVGLMQAVVSSSAADKPSAEQSKGVTVDDLGRGLKSAAKNVEKEIPKVGSAIGNAFKKITEKGTEKPAK